MDRGTSITPQAALLRVLITGESDGSELRRKIRTWTGGEIDLDEPGFLAATNALKSKGMVEQHSSAADKRTGQPRLTYALTPAGHAAAMAVLAASLTRKN